MPKLYSLAGGGPRRTHLGISAAANVIWNEHDDRTIRETRRFQAAGIKTTATLLKAGGTPKGRKSLEETTGLSGVRLLEWCNHADLMRITGVGKQFAELLEAAGVDTVKELKNRNAANLGDAMKATNAKKMWPRLRRPLRW